MKPLRIGFLLPSHSPHSSSHMPVVMGLLSAAGTVVDIVHPAARMVDCSSVRVEHDLYVLKKKSGLTYVVSHPTELAPLLDGGRRCGQAFGTDLFGVDIIESGGRPYVVDMSSIPGFRGVPDAAVRLAEYLYAAARSAPGQPSIPSIAVVPTDAPAAASPGGMRQIR